MHDLYNDIERYKRGDLTPSEMHALEKKALTDPFLADALDGIEKVSAEELSQDLNQLREKISPQTKRIIFTPLRIAAGVVLILGVSMLFYFIGSAPAEQSEMMAEKIMLDSISTKKTADSAASGNFLTLNEPKKADQDVTGQRRKQLAVKPNVALEKSNAEQQTTTAEEEKSAGEIKVTGPETKPTEISATKDLKVEEDLAVTENLASTSKKETAESTQRDEQPKGESRSRKLAAPSVTSSGGVASDLTNSMNATGQVTSAEDGAAMPGVNVVIKGTSIGTITDENGKFSIQMPSTGEQTLVFSFIGSQPSEIPVTSDKPLSVKLQSDVAQLSEVVIVGYGDDDDAALEPTIPTFLLAEPTGGRRSFKKYLETNLQYPQQALENKIEGRVTIQFTVKADGVLDDFRVIKGLGYGCDNEVIRLIKGGPKWSPSRRGETIVESRMRVRLRFKLPEEKR